MPFPLLLSQLKKINLPIGQYVIVSSGSLAARGIREAQDLDILVTPELFDQLAQMYPVTQIEQRKIIALENIELMGHGSIFADNSIASIEDQINNADIIDGIPYQNLDTVIKFKQKLGREKDHKDIQLINNYMKNKTT